MAEPDFMQYGSHRHLPDKTNAYHERPVYAEEPVCRWWRIPIT